MKNKGMLFPEAGTVEKMRCDVCNAWMDIVRNVRGSKSWGGAMAGIITTFDQFICPYIKAPWHVNLLQLREEAERTVSKKIRAIIEQEMEEILSNVLRKLRR